MSKKMTSKKIVCFPNKSLKGLTLSETNTVNTKAHIYTTVLCSINLCPTSENMRGH